MPWISEWGRYEFVASWLRPEIRDSIEAALGWGIHGSLAGYKRHVQRSELPCPSCTQARRAVLPAQRARDASIS